MERRIYITNERGREHYLVVQPKEMPIYETEILCRRKESRLLPIEFVVENGQTQLWHRLTGCISFRTMLELKIFRTEDLDNFFQSTYKVMMELERRLLNPKGILLDLDQIFFLRDKKQVFFCYCPDKEDEIKDGLLHLAEELLTLVDYKNQMLISCIYGAYELMNTENPDYQGLMEICKRAPMANGDASEEVIESEPEETWTEEIWEEEAQPKKGVRMDFDRIQSASKQWCRDQWRAIQKKVQRKWDDYADLSSIIIRPEEACDSPTMYLGEERGNYGRKYCLQGEGENESRRIVLGESRIILGKNKEAVDEIIEGEGVSRMHAFISKEEDGYYLEDLNSLNGTFVNGERLIYKERVCLKENDRITIGGKSFCFCLL